MKLLFDQNLSYKLAALLITEFPDSAHVKEFALQEDDDLAVWKFAKSKGYTIVTKDIDFYEISLIHFHPPKIIWLRVGNLPTREICDILKRNYEGIIDFHAKEVSCLDIYRGV